MSLAPSDFVEVAANLDFITTKVEEELQKKEVMKRYEGVPWAQWLLTHYYHLFLDEATGQFIPFSDFHREFWEWVFSIDKGTAPKPFLAVWPRGAGKSTNVELAIQYLLGEGIRKYCIYVSGTQIQADKHLGEIESGLEHPSITYAYPKLARASMSKAKRAKGWNVSRLHTDSGIMESAGLDKAQRGARIEAQRPDLLVLDDIDEEDDSPRTVEKKIDRITRAILPMADRDRMAVLIAQNIVNDYGVVAQMVDGRADFLRNRILSGPHPAIRDMTYEEGPEGFRITGGEPTWDGLSIPVCEVLINQGEGLRAFEIERQHKRGLRRGSIWKQNEIDDNRWNNIQIPDLKSVYVAVDPAASDTPGNSETGIVVAGSVDVGEGPDHGFVLKDLSGHYSTDEWASMAIRAYREMEANGIVAEVNQGGDMVRHAIHAIDASIPVAMVRAKRGKVLRAEPVQQLYAQRRVHHYMRNFAQLEEQMTTPYDANHPSITFDRMDALVYALWALLISEDALPHLSTSRHKAARPRRKR